MWTTLAVLAALGTTAAADAPSLQVSHPRLTYGLYGPVRGNANLQAGDSLDLAYDIEGLTISPSGEVEFSTDLEILDKDGKSLFKREGTPQKSILSLGGNQMPGMAHLDVGPKSPAGQYTVRVTVTDVISKRSKTFDQTVQVQQPEFGIVRVSTTSDNQGSNPTAVPGRGEVLFINFAVVNFGRGAKEKEKQPHVAFEMQILDEEGKPTTRNPFSGTVKDMVPESALAVPGQFAISLNRGGKFRVVLKATCQVSKKSAEVSFPLIVAAPK